jgi:hypothetical protein
MNKHWIEPIEIGKSKENYLDKEQVEAIVIPENCDWGLVPKIEEMKQKDIDVIVLKVEDFAEMFATISNE